MYLLYLGVTHHNTPITIREKIQFKQDDLPLALEQLKHEKSILEAVVLSTCNRTEFYLVVDQLHTGKYYAKHFLAKWFQIDSKELEKYLVFKETENVFIHLFKVASGLDSRIIGETQILGQIKRAFEIAHLQQATGTILNYLFRQAIAFAKTMHTDYKINERPTSISLIAMQYVEQLQIKPEETTVSVLGLGEIGQLIVRYLKEYNFKKVYLINRTLDKVQPFLSSTYEAVTFANKEIAFQQSQLIFSAIHYDNYVVLPEMVQKDSVLFDLSVPRTIHPHCQQKSRLYDVDSLTQSLLDYTLQREVIAQNILKHIQEECLKFYEWRKQLGIVPLIRQVREKALVAKASVTDSLYRKLPNLTDQEKKQIEKHMKSLINQMLKEPILQLKELAGKEDSLQHIALVAQIFGLKVEEDESNEDN